MTSTRDALVDAAAELLTAWGTAAVTLREVGRRAGVSHNAPYKHFADKEELLAAVGARDLARRGASSNPARRGAPPRPPAPARPLDRGPPRPHTDRGRAGDAPRLRPPRGGRSRAVPP